MIKNNNEGSFFGIKANEEWALFIHNKNSNLPIIIENIGITNANPKYCVSRQNNDMFIFEYVISGTGYIEVNNKTYKVSSGDVYIIEPGQSHTYYSDEKDPFKKIWINFYSKIFIDIYKSFNLTGKIVFKNSETLELFEKIQSLKKISNFSDELCYEIAPILFQIICNLSTKSNKQSIISKTAKTTKELIDESICTNTTIDDIASKLFLSKSHVIREFTKYYGVSPYNYLINQKIAIAKKMLLLHNMNINEISNQLGFDDSHYFSRLFKKKTGLSPLQYRKSKTKKSNNKQR